MPAGETLMIYSGGAGTGNLHASPDGKVAWCTGQALANPQRDWNIVAGMRGKLGCISRALLRSMLYCVLCLRSAYSSALCYIPRASVCSIYLRLCCCWLFKDRIIDCWLESLQLQRGHV